MEFVFRIERRKKEFPKKPVTSVQSVVDSNLKAISTSEFGMKPSSSEDLIGRLAAWFSATRNRLRNGSKRGLGSIFTLVVALAVQACSTVPLTKTPPPRPKHPSTMRIGTYNVLTGARDTPKTANVIRSMQADVVMLQELSPKGSELLQSALRRDFRYQHFSHGVAILSRFPMQEPRYHQSQDGINGFMIAEIDSPGGHLQVVSLHLDPLHLWTRSDKCTLPMQILWGKAAVHRAEVRQIQGSLKPGIPTILAGDFNSVDHTAIKQLAKLGYTDSYAAVSACPDRTATLNFKLLGLKAGRRIDFILHDRSFRTVESIVLPGPPSDHNPVVSTVLWDVPQNPIAGSPESCLNP